MSDTPNKGGNPKGTSQVRNSGVKKIQALAMMRELALGKSVTEVAKQFNVSNTIVRARLSYAQRAGLFVHHEDVILTQMVPASENVLLSALHDPYLDPALRIKVALEVQKGVGLLRKPGTAVPAALQGANKKAALTLQDYINQLRDSEGKLPEGVAIDTEYSIAGEFESLALPSGEHEPATEERADSAGPDVLHGTVASPTGEGTGETEQEAGNGDGVGNAQLSGEAQSGPSEPSDENRSVREGAVSDDERGDDWLGDDSGQTAQEPIQEFP